MGFGFYELSDNFVSHPDHKGFIEATEKPAEELKLAMRNWRELVHNSAYRKIDNYATWKQKLQDSATILEKAWKNYETSHPVLHKVTQVFKQSDIYKKYYLYYGKDKKKKNHYFDEGSKKVEALLHKEDKESK